MALEFLLSSAGVVKLAPKLITEIWPQARTATLIASLASEDIEDEFVQKRIINLLFQGGSSKIPTFFLKSFMISSFTLPYSEKLGDMVGSLSSNKYIAKPLDFAYKKAVNFSKKRIVNYLPIKDLSNYFTSNSLSIQELALKEFFPNLNERSKH